MNDKYFATLTKKEDLLQELMRRVRGYNEFISTAGFVSLWKKSYNQYYGKDKDGFKSSRVNRTGAQGELTKLVVNHYRNLITHMHVMTTNQKPAFQARAANTDYKSQTQAILANRLIDYYLRDKKVGEYTDQAAELALMLGEGWNSVFWNPSAGDPYIADKSGKQKSTGDLEFNTYGPMEVVRDVNATGVKELDWVILKDFVNKYTIAAKYPKKRENILEVKNEDILEESSRAYGLVDDFSDMIIRYTFVHRKTEALPEGRIVQFLSEDVGLFDSPLAYDDVNVFRMSPGEIIGSPFGYTIGFDILGLNDTVGALYSTVATNQLTFGVQNILAEETANVGIKELTGGLNLITYNKHKPESMNLTQTPPEIFNFIGQLEKLMETISGVNSVVRGDTPANIRSGNAMALLASQTIQFNSGLQKSYASHLENVASAIINILKNFANVPRIASIVGDMNKAYLKEFKGEDLVNINRVSVELINPVARTAAGRLEIANNLLQNGLLQNKDQYMMVLETGQLEPLTESKTKEMLNIRSENELLSGGKQALAVAVDSHALHIAEHKNVLSDPEVRKEPSVVKNCLAHIQDHILLLQNTDPNLLMLTGQQPLQPQQGQAPQGGQGQAPQGGQGIAPVMEAPKQGSNQMEGQLPKMPDNPLTGQAYNPETGGL